MFLTTYLREVVREIKQVTWPTRQQTIDKTLLVIAVSVIVSLYLGIVDALLQRFITWFL
ncbi:MAG: preprotein translocase subunit SecE [Candidatus Pacebacteria bacterium RIFCSPHIGHO2_01_FULL_46_16]|nr:MAG: preprotein translocase subunit SecE [Candidatus Pacebacteria bacterium RIFCSPHIGHO2_01_FULL_46_16]OGJ38760.1 MAG: preprotein translocase subunit SecE [Candidatus Pacebacteria bacterium RIFCSPLOWO2_01_FULL_47_12]